MKVHPASTVGRLHREHGRGIVRGVEFDFYHPDVGDSWQPTSPIGFQNAKPFGSRLKGPRLIFPWTRMRPDPEMARREALSGDALMRHIMEYGDDGWFGPGDPIFDERTTLSGRPLLRHLIAHGPDAWIAEGDRIFIRSARRVRVGDQFASASEAYALSVRYSVHRSGGLVEDIRGRTIYAHRDHPTPWEISDGNIRLDAGLSLETAKRRLSAILSEGALDEDGFPTELCEPNAARCLYKTWAADRALSRAKKLTAWDARDLIEVGFYLATAEAALNLRSQAERGLKSVEGGGLGGRIAAENRRLWRERNWAPEALKLGQRERKRSVSRSQKDLAADIQAAWTLAGAAPTFDWLLAFVRKAEKDGKIPKRTPKSALRAGRR